MTCNSSSRSGQTLIEAIVALSLIAVAVFGVFSVLNQSLGLNRTVTDRYIGNYLSIEGVEVVKNIIDTNILQGRLWNDGLIAGTYEVVYNSSALLANSNRFFTVHPVTNIYSYDSALGNLTTSFKRKITINYPDCPDPNCSDHVQVNSLASWTTTGGGDFSINLEDHFFNWNK